MKLSISDAVKIEGEMEKYRIFYSRFAKRWIFAQGTKHIETFALKAPAIRYARAKCRWKDLRGISSRLLIYNLDKTQVEVVSYLQGVLYERYSARARSRRPDSTRPGTPT